MGYRDTLGTLGKEENRTVTLLVLSLLAPSFSPTQAWVLMSTICSRTKEKIYLLGVSFCPAQVPDTDTDTDMGVARLFSVIPGVVCGVLLLFSEMNVLYGQHKQPGL